MLLNTGIKTVKTLCLFSALLFSQNLLAARDLPEFTANYAIQAFGMKVAEAQYRLSYTPTGYKITQKTDLYGIASLFRDDAVNVVSYVDDSDNILLLKKHRYIQTGKEKNKDEIFDIQWNTASKTPKGKITGIVRNRKVSLETETPVWDVLSFQIPLMIDANEDVKEYPYNAVLHGEIDTYKFILAAVKNIDFAGKKYRALQMIRQDPDRDRQLHIWLLPELHNIPVIIENYRDGKIHSRMVLESVKFDNQKTIHAENADDDDY